MPLRLVRRTFAFALVGVTMSGCMHRGGTRPNPGSHDRITMEELDRFKDLTLFDAVSKLRPHFLRNRAITAQGKAPRSPLMLYVNGEKMEGVEDLRHMWPSDVQEVRFYEPHIANTVFARYNNAGGAISVVLRKTDG